MDTSGIPERLERERRDALARLAAAVDEGDPSVVERAHREVAALEAEIQTARLSERLERVRKASGHGDLLSFWKALGGKKGTGVSYESARRYHTDREPSIGYLLAVAERFNVSLEYLTGAAASPRAERFVRFELPVAVPDAFREAVAAFLLELSRFRADAPEDWTSFVLDAFAGPLRLVQAGATHGEVMAALHAQLAQLYVASFGSTFVLKGRRPAREEPLQVDDQGHLKLSDAERRGWEKISEIAADKYKRPKEGGDAEA